MQYRKFGNTGFNISALGFGAMRLPEYERDGIKHVEEERSIQMIHRAFDLGVNYIDTAYGYLNGKSEIVVGRALKGYRDRVRLSTKFPMWKVEDKSDYRRTLEEQLKKLDTDHIDFYHFHGVNKERWENVVLKYDLLDDAVKAKGEGLIKHISFSFHDTPEFLKELIDVGVFESVLCQYNLLDRTNEEAISYARQKGLGTVIMGPVGGGRLAAPSELFKNVLGDKAESTPEIALRFVLSNRDVSCALSGMGTMEMVEENAKVASNEEPLSREEIHAVEKLLDETRRLADLYCTGCDYCMPCPAGINIPHVFRLMNYHRVYKLTDYAKGEFARLGRGGSVGENPQVCTECGICETKCPQNIEIRRQLKQTLEELGYE